MWRIPHISIDLPGIISELDAIEKRCLKLPQDSVQCGETDVDALIKQVEDIAQMRSNLWQKIKDGPWYHDEHISCSAVIPEVIQRLKGNLGRCGVH